MPQTAPWKESTEIHAPGVADDLVKPISESEIKETLKTLSD